MTVLGEFLATGIGSMPFEDPEHAIDVSLRSLPQAPFWPQLPRLGLNEQMEIQYSEGLPCAIIDRDKLRMYFETSGDYSEAFAEFYQAYITAMDPDEGTGDCSSVAISPEFAAGFYAFKERLSKTNTRLPFVKVQTTGPCSMGLTLVDENKRAIYYNEEFRDMLIKAMSMKCRWQIQQVRDFADKVICFIDEPILSAFGSSTYVSVEREDIVSALNEVIDTIHADRALAGVHCCGNTEWSILVDAGVDLVNFDAFDYGESIAMYPDAVAALFERGGALAWGIVPTSTAIREQTPESLKAHFERMIDNLASRGIDRELIARHAVITPSCGTGSMEPQDAEKVFETLGALSKLMKEQYGF